LKGKLCLQHWLIVHLWRTPVFKHDLKAHAAIDIAAWLFAGCLLDYC
jgi:hypothetical protein